MLGWTAATIGTANGVPQIVKLVRGRTSAGLSLFMWQLFLMANIGWTTHGILTAQPVMIGPNLISLVMTLAILRLIRLDRGLRPSRIYPIGILGGVISVAVDVLLGPAAFGWVVLIPLALGTLGQLKDLVVDPDLSGVSLLFLAGSTLIQGLWVTWASIVGEVSVLICGSSLLVLCGINLVWYVLRTFFGVPPYGRARTHAAELAEDPV